MTLRPQVSPQTWCVRAPAPRCTAPHDTAEQEVVCDTAAIAAAAAANALRWRQLLQAEEALTTSAAALGKAACAADRAGANDAAAVQALERVLTKVRGWLRMRCVCLRALQLTALALCRGALRACG